MADIKKLIQILNQKASEDQGPKSKKVQGTGLSLYEGGIEKTPTGKSNAFVKSGLTEQDILDYARKYNLPTTSNKEFQQAQIDMLMKTSKGRDLVNKMYETYGPTKAGTYVDDILGARTLGLMQNTPAPMQQSITTTRNIQPAPTPAVLTKSASATPKKEKEYTISWRDDNSDNLISSQSFPNEKDYELELAKIENRGAGRGIRARTITGQGKGESSRTALFIGNPAASEKRSVKDIEFAKENYRKRLNELKGKYKLSDEEIDNLVNEFK